MKKYLLIFCVTVAVILVGAWSISLLEDQTPAADEAYVKSQFIEPASSVQRHC